MRCGLASNPPRDSQVSGKKRKVDNESRKLWNKLNEDNVKERMNLNVRRQAWMLEFIKGKQQIKDIN
jgi:hypothetical protein